MTWCCFIQTLYATVTICPASMAARKMESIINQTIMHFIWRLNVWADLFGGGVIILVSLSIWSKGSFLMHTSLHVNMSCFGIWRWHSWSLILISYACLLWPVVFCSCCDAERSFSSAAAYISWELSSPSCQGWIIWIPHLLLDDSCIMCTTHLKWQELWKLFTVG